MYNHIFHSSDIASIYVSHLGVFITSKKIINFQKIQGRVQLRSEVISPSSWKTSKRVLRFKGLILAWLS